MPEVIVYLLKANRVLTVFVGAYYLFLRRLTFYTMNRWYLMFCLLFAAIYPLIDLQEFSESYPTIQQKVEMLIPVISKPQTLWQKLVSSENRPELILALFSIGVLTVTTRLFIQIASLLAIHKKSTTAIVNDNLVRVLNEPVSPFSFWRSIYLNPALHEPEDLQAIIQHELIHVKQLHSLDILLTELGIILSWFNPVAWIFRKAVRENLEFITDQQLVQQGVDKKVYQYSLLKVSMLQPASSVGNNFNFSDLKKRFVMMNLKPSSKLSVSRYLVILPLLLAGTLAFTFSNASIVNTVLSPVLNNEIITPVQTSSTTPVTIVVKPARSGLNLKKFRTRKIQPSEIKYFQERPADLVITGPAPQTIQLKPINPGLIPAQREEIVVVGYASGKRKINPDSASTTSNLEPRTVIGLSLKQAQENAPKN